MQQPNSIEKTPIKYPSRPNRNPNIEEKDRKIRAICNLRQITLNTSDIKLRQYAIHFEPEIAEDNLPLKKKIIHQLNNELKKHFKRYLPSGDTLFAAGKNLPENIPLETKNDSDDTLYKVQLVLTKNIIDCRNIRTITKEHIKIKHVVELMIKKIIHFNNHIIRFDDGFYDYNDSEFFGRDGKATIYHGYSTAVCITENGLFLRLNDKNKMITGKTAYEKMIELSKKYNGNMFNESYIRDIKDYFIGKTVVTKYGIYRPYRIGDVLTDKNLTNTTLNMTNGEGKSETVSLKNYYKIQYNINIKNELQPLFVDEDSMKKEDSKKRYIVPELVYLTGIDELEERDRADIIAKSKYQPPLKIKKIEKGMLYLTNTEKKIPYKKNKQQTDHLSPNDVRNEWGINFGESFVQVEGRVLPLPELEFGGCRPEKPLINHGRLRQKKDKLGVNFDGNNCCLITFNNLINLAKGDCDNLCKACGAFGISFKFPHLIKLNSSNNDDLIQELHNLKIDQNKKMVIVVLDRNTKHLYPLIKDFLYTEKGITSQFMLHDENPNKGGKKKQNMSYYSGVLNQMVVKAKGELFGLKFCNGMDSGPSMIIGIDSSKLSQGKGNKYVVSASYNRKFNKFYTDIGNGTNAEDDRTLVKLLSNCLRNFKDNNNILPNTVVIYRQGGNEKQTEKIIKKELPKILDLFSGKESDEFYKNEKPRLTVFSVNKKTDLKFFEPVNNGYKNIPMGTVIDKDVISPELFEFYLQCPDVDRGCASPVHFLCIYNDNKSMSLNDYEDVSFKQSFYYWNWPGPIRVPAALKYAEVANTFSNKYLTHEVKDELKDSPYYI